MITLGRSDAILAVDIIKLYLEDQKVFLSHAAADYDQEVRDLLEFLQVQLHSMAESPSE